MGFFSSIFGSPDKPEYGKELPESLYNKVVTKTEEGKEYYAIYSTTNVKTGEVQYWVGCPPIGGKYMQGSAYGYLHGYIKKQ